MASPTTKSSPQSNLKDRIAALQRLNQQNNNGTSNSNLAPPSIGSGGQGNAARVSLRDKIAKFEQRGGTPIPRGSFGMGAPPPEDVTSKKKGELLGNRVPGLNKPTIALPNDRSAPPSASTKSFARQRYTSTSDLDLSSPPETPSEFGLKARSPTMAATVSGRVGMLEVASAGAVDSFRDTGAATSPRRNSIAGRRTVSDSYGPYGLSSPSTTNNGIKDVTESPKDVVIQDVKQLSSEPEPLDASEQPSASPKAAEPVTDAVPTIAVPTIAVPTIALVAEDPRETTPTPAKGGVDLKIEVPNHEEDTQPSQPATSNSAATPNIMSPLTPATANTAASGDDSFAFDMSVAEIVTAHTEILPPPSKAILVPAPPASSPPPSTVNATSDSTTLSSSTPSESSNSKLIGESQPKLRKKVYANSGPGFQELSLTPKIPSRKSFTAVVHKKNKDSVSTTRSSTDTTPPAPLPITPARPRMPTADTERPPASPGAGELAWLVAEAAMLEKALGVDSSSNEDFSEPDYSVPLFTRPKSAVQTSTPPVPELVRDDASSEQTDPTPSTYSPYPVPTVREVGEEEEEEEEDEFNPLTPAKSTRSRKLSSKIKSLASTSSSTLRSFSSSNSRPSMSSEMSSEDSNRGRRSPQPSEDNGSLSSSRWSPSPKKNPLSRATSFADRIMNRSAKTKSTYLDDSTDNVHLSPSRASTVSISRSKKSSEKTRSLSSHTSAPRLNLPNFSFSESPSSSPAQAQSNSSTTSSSSGLFDKELFDAFPSVPTGIPSPLPSSTSTLSLNSKSFANRSSSTTIRNP